MHRPRTAAHAAPPSPLCVTADPEQLSLPCLYMRGGSSKGGFFLAADLPARSVERDATLLAAYGSPDARQIDGIGGADPLTSKAAIVARSRRPTRTSNTPSARSTSRAQVSTGGNCGNMLAAVGPYAVLRGLIPAREGQNRVRIYTTNTKQVVEASFAVRAGVPCVEGPTVVPGCRAAARRWPSTSATARARYPGPCCLPARPPTPSRSTGARPRLADRCGHAVRLRGGRGHRRRRHRHPAGHPERQCAHGPPGAGARLGRRDARPGRRRPQGARDQSQRAARDDDIGAARLRGGRHAHQGRRHQPVRAPAGDAETAQGPGGDWRGVHRHRLPHPRFGGAGAIARRYRQRDPAWPSIRRAFGRFAGGPDTSRATGPQRPP